MSTTNLIFKSLLFGVFMLIGHNVIDFVFARYGEAYAHTTPNISWKWGAFLIDGEVQGTFFNSTKGLISVAVYTLIMFFVLRFTNRYTASTTR